MTHFEKICHCVKPETLRIYWENTMERIVRGHANKIPITSNTDMVYLDVKRVCYGLAVISML